MKRYLWVGALLVTLAGILLTGYLTKAHFTGSIGNICRQGQGCGVVLQSTWSQFAGLPTAFYGFCYYLLAFLLFLVYPTVAEKHQSTLLHGLLGLNLAAFGISVALVSYALIGLGATCSFCNSSLALVTLITGGTLYWKYSSRNQPMAEPSKATWQIATILLLVSSLVLGGLFMSQRTTDRPETADQTTTEIQALASDSRSVGNPSAPIRVVEFFDLACPHCQKFTLNTFPRIKKNYIDTGKVLWTFRFFPITRAHPHSLYAHGALAMVPPNDFLSAKKTIMRQAARWDGRRNDDPRNYFGLFLSQYGLNQGPSRDLLRQIRSRTRDYAELGIRQTPSFVVNGKIHKGGLPYRRWQSIFEKLLPETK